MSSSFLSRFSACRSSLVRLLSVREADCIVAQILLVDETEPPQHWKQSSQSVYVSASRNVLVPTRELVSQSCLSDRHPRLQQAEIPSTTTAQTLRLT